MTLNIIILALSLIGSVSLWLGLSSFSAWWLLLLVPAFYVGVTFLYYFTLWIVSLFLPKHEPKRTSAICRFFTWLSMDWLMLVMGIRIKTTGAELLPNTPCVFVSNHRSDFDPMTMLAVFKKRKLVYISKEGNFKIPIVGPFIRQAGFISIDRANGVRAVRTLNHAADRMKEEGLDVGIYPEGTRSKNLKLLRFKTGAFYLAQKAEAPIVVMTTRGTEKISGGGFLFRRVRVELKILEVFDRETVMNTSQEELAARARALIEADLPDLPKEEPPAD